jgi:hypothetical protein
MPSERESIMLFAKISLAEYLLLPTKRIDACPIPKLPKVTNKDGSRRPKK